ncbi:methyl-accepting chemotaxis protein [Gammaproteobacteria bacterium]
MFQRMKIGIRLWGGFGLLLLMLVVVTGIGIYGLDITQDAVDAVVKDRYPKIVLANEIGSRIDHIVRHARNIIIIKDLEKQKAEITAILKAHQIVIEKLGVLASRIGDKKGKELLKNINDSLKVYITVQDRFLEMVQNSRFDEATQLLFGEMNLLQDRYEKNVDSLISYQEELMEQAGSNAEDIQDRGMMLLLVVAGIALIMALGLALWIGLSVTRPLDKTVAFIGRIGRGDIPESVQEPWPGEFDGIRESLNAAGVAIHALIEDVRILIQAGTEGRLAVRADTVRHLGNYQRIVEGFNVTLDTIVGPVIEVMRVMAAVEKGNLTQQISPQYQGMLGQLRDSVNQMVAGLREVAGQTRNATENLNSATIQIRASTQEQAASVEEQLAAVQQTSATLDEITQSGVQISRRAKEVVIAAEAAMTSSQSGLRAVEDTTHAMDSIRDQAESVAENIVTLSEKTQVIGEIIISVNEIAERSHLLALNAAIEAVAAGEHGRRFSVVAAEIKNLADQAKEATAQVRTILGDIQRGINASVMLTEEAVKRIAFGKEHTDATQRNIQEMSNNIRESVQTFQQIVAATNQHQIGLEQVMVALQNIRQASKQTADTTRQLDGAAANLSALSQQLTHTVSGYQL